MIYEYVCPNETCKKHNEKVDFLTNKINFCPVCDKCGEELAKNQTAAYVRYKGGGWTKRVRPDYKKYGEK